MPPKGAAQRAEQAGGGRGGDPRPRERPAHPGLDRGGGAAGRRRGGQPRRGGAAARPGGRGSRRGSRPSWRGPRSRGRPPGRRRGRRTTSPASRRRSTRMVRLKRAEADCLAADGRSGYDALLDDYEPGTTAAELEGLFGRLRPGLAALRARIAAARRPAPALRRALPARARSWRCRGGSATSSATTGRRGGSTSRCIRRPRARAATCGSPPASTRPTRASASTRPSTRSGTRSTSRGSTRRWRCCRRDRTPRWGCTRASRGCSRTSSGAAGPSAPGSGRRCASAFGELRPRRAGGALPRGQRGRDRLHPHRGGRGPLQPARDDALRPGAGADRRATSRSRTSRRRGTRRFAADFGREVPDARRGVLQDVHWSVGLFGYFPTYTLGNIYAAELHAALRRDLPDLDDAAGGGRPRAGRRLARARASTAAAGCWRRGR